MVPGPIAGRWTSGPDLGERWPARLVATAEEDRLNTTLRPRDRRTQPARQRTYIRLYAQVDRLEDTISHFYNVINELRRRVSAEKKSKPLAKR